MKFVLFFILLSSLSYLGISQPDSLHNNYDIQNIVRPKKLISINYYWTSPYSLKSSDDIILNGIELNKNQGYSINGVLPIYMPEKSRVRFMVNYSYLRTSFGTSLDSIFYTRESDNYTTNRYMISPIMILNYRLGNKTVVHVLNVSLNSFYFFKPSYFSVMFTSNVILKRTQYKSSSIGLSIIYLDNSNWPIIPLPTYSYNSFINPKWTFEMTLPFSIGIRRIQNEKFSIKSSAKLDVLNSLFRPQYYDNITRFSDIGVAVQINMEYKIFKYINWQSTIQYKYSFGTKVIDTTDGVELFQFNANSKFMINTGLSFSL